MCSHTLALVLPKRARACSVFGETEFALHTQMHAPLFKQLQNQFNKGVDSLSATKPSFQELDVA